MRPSLFPLAAVFLALSVTPSPAAARGPAQGSKPAVRHSPSVIDNNDRMDVNNLDMVVTNHGSFAFDLLTGGAGLVYPRGTDKTAVFAAGLWLGGLVGGEARVAVAEYSQEFAPGPMANGTFLDDRTDFRNYTIVRGNTATEDYLDWPVVQGAPVDANGDPLLLGDVTIWSVYNDANPARHTNLAGSTAPLGIEIQQTVFAFNRTGPLGNMIFFRWIVANKGASSLGSVYVSLWSDPDLGGFADDLVGCDTTLALGYCYNATNADLVYGGRPPAVGLQLLRGPLAAGGVPLGMSAFNRYISGTDPRSAVETYGYMRGLDQQGQPVHVFDDPSQPLTTYLVSGLNPSAPNSPANWLDANPSDRRFMVSSGPFDMPTGATQEIRAVLIVGQGSDRLSSIADLRAKAAVARTLSVFDPPLPPPPIHATVDISPNVIPLAGRAPWVTAFVQSEAFTPEEVQPSSVRLGGVLADPKWMIVGDHDGDGALDAGFKFSRAALAPFLRPGMNHVTLKGRLSSGASFEGADDINVIPAPNSGGPHAAVIPNPLNPSGTLRFETTIPGRARIRIFDVSGRLVHGSEIDALPAGRHALPIAREQELRSGIYLYRLETSEGSSSGRFVVLK